MSGSTTDDDCSPMSPPTTSNRNSTDSTGAYSLEKGAYPLERGYSLEKEPSPPPPPPPAKPALPGAKPALAGVAGVRPPPELPMPPPPTTPLPPDAELLPVTPGLGTDIVLERSGDGVYSATTAVVRAVMDMSKGVQAVQTQHYVTLVRNVGLQLKTLLSSVDDLMPQLPASSHHAIEMAHKVLSSDMAELVNSMRLAQKYASTYLDDQYRKGMLKAAHVLAMDSKNLLDAVDNGRRVLLTYQTAASLAESSAAVAAAAYKDDASAGVGISAEGPEGEEAVWSDSVAAADGYNRENNNEDKEKFFDKTVHDESDGAEQFFTRPVRDISEAGDTVTSPVGDDGKYADDISGDGLVPQQS